MLELFTKLPLKKFRSFSFFKTGCPKFTKKLDIPCYDCLLINNKHLFIFALSLQEISSFFSEFRTACLKETKTSKFLMEV